MKPHALTQMIPPNLRHTLMLRGMTLAKIPLIFFVSPTVVELTEGRAEICIPLNWRTKNHWGSMYFGVLAVGADCAGGLYCFNLLESVNRRLKKSGEKARIDLLFKDFHAEFLKRADGDVHFACEQGREISDLVSKAVKSGEREEMPVYITARVPKNGDEPVARFTLTLSIKKKASKLG